MRSIIRLLVRIAVFLSLRRVDSGLKEHYTGGQVAKLEEMCRFVLPQKFSVWEVLLLAIMFGLDKKQSFPVIWEVPSPLKIMPK